MQIYKNLNALAKPVILGSMLVIVGSFSNVTLAATTIGTEFTAKQRLKLSRLASKNRQNIDLDSYIQLDDKRQDAFDENNNECGNIEIGNIEKPRIGQSIKPIDVIVVGDVINVADDC